MYFYPQLCLSCVFVHHGHYLVSTAAFFVLQESFPDYPELLRVAVSLGRRSQEPLHEFTALFASPDNEFLSLHLHSLQGSLPVDKLKWMLEIEIVNRVNDVGVDVNFAMEHPHTAPMLQYVCGLGPRKAPALIKVILKLE